MIARSIKAKALVFAVFFLGIATGIVIANFYTSRVTGSDRGRPQGDINKFYDYLGLDDAQREQMHKIGEETQRQFRELRKETQPRFRAIEDESRAKIRGVLNEEQREKYDQFRKRMDERRQNRNDTDRGPNPERGPRPN
jgi:hypothetical protein